MAVPPPPTKGRSWTLSMALGSTRAVLSSSSDAVTHVPPPIHGPHSPGETMSGIHITPLQQLL